MTRAQAASAVVALAAVLAACKGEITKAEPPPPTRPGEVALTDAQIADAKVKVAPLSEQEVDDVIVTSGRIAFEESRVSHVFSAVSGRITRIEVKTGQRVKRGDVLAIIESPDIGLASADLQKAQSDLIAAQHDIERQRELLAAHATSQRDFEQAEDAYRKATAEVERAKQKTVLLRQGTTGVSQTYVIRAELDGEIISRNATVGTEVAGQYGGTAVELFTLGELDKVWVLADVYEMDSARVLVGSKVNIKLFAFPGKVFPAKVEWIAGALDPATRTAKVRCVLDNADRALKPEMYATLFISVEERRALAIPRGALLRLGEQLAVFVEKGKSPDGRRLFVRTPVTVDESEGGLWLPLTGGVEKGAPIVVEGGILLSGGSEGAR